MSLQYILIDWRSLQDEYPYLEPDISLAGFRSFFEGLDQTFHPLRPKILVVLPQNPNLIPGWQAFEAHLKSLNLKSSLHFVAFGDIAISQYAIIGKVLVIKALYCDVFLLNGIFEFGMASRQNRAASISPGFVVAKGDINTEKIKHQGIKPTAYSDFNIFYCDFADKQSLLNALASCYEHPDINAAPRPMIIQPFGRAWPPLISPTIDATWTLFLDRDGVINQRIVGGYVKSPDEFIFLPGVLESISRFSQVFGRIVVVTNQQGIGKGLMTVEELALIHHKMNVEVTAAGGQIDKIYHCPGLAEHQPVCRKPLPGMAIEAISDFPEIDLSKSIMVGDSLSDIEFGRRLGMFTAKIGMTCHIEHIRVDQLIDLEDIITYQ